MLSQKDLLNMTPIDRQLAALQLGEGLYFSGDEELLLSAQTFASSITVTVQGTFFSFRSGYVPFSFSLAVGSDRLPDTATLPLDEGILLNAIVFASGPTPGPGGCYAQLFKQRGGSGATTALDVILSGYVTSVNTLAFPPRLNNDQASGPGTIRSITGTDPAAGVEISEAVPTNAIWELLSFRASLVCDGTVATRSPKLAIDDGTTTLFRSPITGNLTASETGIYNFAPGLEINNGADNAITGPLPIGYKLLEGFQISTETGNLQAGDNWSAPQLLVREWILN